ncbi:MAG: nucleotide-binding protein [Acidimicrobiia bacterium]|nr:nucleotide-binding protein [Acidimicrobiia bacterium]
MSTLPAKQPPVNLETKPFWDATTEGKFLLKRCVACGFVIWYPRGLCPDCGADGAEWFEASGRGTVYTYTVIRRGQGRWRDAAPYALAYVELEEGPRVMTNIVDCDPDALSIGQTVEVTFDDTGEGAALYRFRPC